jgi:Glycosyltransferase family 87
VRRVGPSRLIPAPSPLPWRRPRHELLLLALVAVAALSPVYGVNPQDDSRLCLSQALVHGRVANDSCLRGMFDKARYKGHYYSDKAPAMSVLEIPAAEAVRLPPPPSLPDWSLRVWAVRVLSSGLAFLACAFLVGRISEGLAPGLGGISLVVFALGTLFESFGAANFDNVPVAALGLAAFAAAWRRRPLLAGLLAGLALCFEYEAAPILLVVGAYVALQGRRPLRDYAVGLVPGAVLLGAYLWAAFGAPWRASYRYVANPLSHDQASGFFGLSAPHLYATYDVFAGNGGLLVVSPVLVAAGWGLVLLARRHRAEALTCAAIVLVFVLVDCGYFLPYGGSPGPRFLVPALPFLALGLGPAFARRPRLVAALGAFSVATATAVTLVWQTDPFRQTVWGEIARIPGRLGSSWYARSLVRNALDWLGPGKGWGAALVAVSAAAAFAAALRTVPWASIREERKRRPASSPRARLAVLAAAGAIVAADTSAVFAYPYGDPSRYDSTPPTGVAPSIWASARTAPLNTEVNFTLTVSDRIGVGYGDLVLTIALPTGMRLIGPPAYEIGSGCTGKVLVTCNLDELSAHSSTAVRFGVDVTEPGDQTLTASVAANGVEFATQISETVEVS